ncbi:MAG: DinB family protein [Rhodothermales bacterium]
METAVRTHSAQTLAAQFDLHTRLFNNVLEGISDADADEQARETVNNIKWLAGHLTSTRYSMKQIGQLEEDDPYSELFSHGHGLRDDVEYPSIKAIKTHWNAISERISTGMARLPEAVLAGPAPAKVPIDDGTMGGMLAFLMHHEAYHIGQMGILRRYLGKEAMKYT